MKVILKRTVKGLGEAGAVVEVSDGYARNFLLPRGLAVEASAANLNQRRLQEERALREAERALAEANRLAGAIDGREVRIASRSSQAGRLFGAVTSQAIAEALAGQLGVTVDRRKIALREPIRATGAYRVAVRLHPQVSAYVTVRVVEE